MPKGNTEHKQKRIKRKILEQSDLEIGSMDEYPLVRSILKKADNEMDKELNKNYFGYKPKIRKQNSRIALFKHVRFAKFESSNNNNNDN